MKRNDATRYLRAGLTPALALVLFGSIGYADPIKMHGLIEGRSGATVILQASDGGARVIVLLTDSTQVGQVQGVLKARRKEMSMAALVPGLAIDVEGEYNGEKQLVAKTIKFTGDDLKRAQAVQAGMHETKAQTRQNQAELEKQNAVLQAHNETLKSQQSAISENQDKIAANKAAIEAATARFGQLDDYYILDEITIYFGNGKTALDPKYKPQLTQFGERAKKVEAYMIQVVGYASASGSEELNQKLSEDRSHSVANFMLQQCRIPLTNVMAPGAMGESEQVGNSKTPEAEAENRRVVVRVLQNKGVAGLSEASRAQ